MNNNVLFVDDDYDIISAYQRNMRNLYSIKTAMSAAEAFIIIKEEPTFAVVVSDFNMPQMNGIQFLTKVKTISPLTSRIMITGFANVETSIEAVNEGNVFRFLTKPMKTDLLIKAINDGIEQFRLQTLERELLDKTLKGSIKVLIDILSASNPVAFAHARNLRYLAKGIADNLLINDTWEIEIAALLSQIGCISIPQDILEKKYRGEKLNPKDNTIFLQHPDFGRQLLANIPKLESIAKSISYQFRSFDNNESTEDEISGNKLPLISRILKVCLDFELIVKSGETSDEAIRMMNEKKNVYDPVILDALSKHIYSTPTNLVLKVISFKKLRIGMIMAEDLRDEKGFLLIPREQEVTDILLMRLLHVSKIRKIIDPIKVYERL